MKYELLKKTLVYRILAFSVGLLNTTLFTLLLLSIGNVGTLTVSLIVAGIVEMLSIGVYYIYEYYWRKLIERRRLKEGAGLLQITGNGKVSISYEVIEDLGEGKLIIEVV